MPECVHCHESVEDAGPADDVGRLWRAEDNRVYCYAAENGYHEADAALAAGPYYPMPEYDRPEGPPKATHWFWAVGDVWDAVVGDHERETWWSGDDPAADMGAPTPWELPIDQRPPSGTVRYRDEHGNEQTEDAHQHVWGPFTRSRIAGTLHRPCIADPACRHVSLDGDDDE